MGIDTTDGALRLTPEQQLLINQAATRLQREFDGVLNVETIERYIADSQTRIGAEARVATWMPLLVERFDPRPLTRSDAARRGCCGRPGGAVLVRAQRRPLPDGGWLAPASRRRPRRGVLGRFRPRSADQCHCGGGDGGGRHRHRQRVPQTVDRRDRPRRRRDRVDGVRRRAPYSPGSATRTGSSPTRPGSRSRSFARSATTSAAASRHWSPTSCRAEPFDPPGHIGASRRG